MESYHFFTLIGLFLQTNVAMGIDGSTWPTETVKWPRETSTILYQNTIEVPPKMTLEELIEKSNEFPIEFPSNETRCFQLKSSTNRKILENNINSAYPLIHERSLQLFVSFLGQKRRFGSNLERDLYQNMTLLELINRFLIKRAVSFVGPEDKYLLLNGTKGKGNWETVGTDNEGPLDLQNCLSYDEIKLSALLSVSSPSYFIGGYLGVVVGAIGPRLEKEKVMEYREIMKTKEQNTRLYGYGESFVPTMQGIFTNFWEDVSATYQELQTWNSFNDSSRYIKIAEDKYFDKWVYTRRISLSIDTLLVEANDRARRQNQIIVLYVPGLGLGQWAITSEQDKLFVDTFIERIKFLGSCLGNIDRVRISHIENYPIYEKIDIEGHRHGGITIETLVEVFRNKPNANEGDGNLVVFSYNWNGNALPGNEYWLHNLTASDAANMATSSQIAELQNPHINRNVQAANLRIVTLKGLVTFKDYLEEHKSD